MSRLLPLVVAVAAVATMAVTTPASAGLTPPQYVRCYELLVATDRSLPPVTVCSPFTP